MEANARIIGAAATVVALGVAAAARRRAIGKAESGDDDYIGTFSLGELAGDLRALWDRLTEQGANVDTSTAARNTRAFLTMLQRAEGTAGQGDPYRVCYGYGHTVRDLSDHPAVTGEWRGAALPGAMCKAAGFSAGCVSTAAGAYQLIKPTWLRMRDRLGLLNFGPAAQDAAAVGLIDARGALADVQAGRFADAVGKCRNEWASLPGNYAGQGQRSLAALEVWYREAGGRTA